MYESNSENKGQYSALSFIKRGLQLVSPIEFFKFSRIYNPGATWLQRLYMMLDFYLCVLRYGTIVSDYFEYEFWKKKACVRKTYITMFHSIRMQRFFNHGSPEKLVNKRLFNEHFSAVHGLRNFYFDTAQTFEAFWEFVMQCNHAIIAKPNWGASGVGIFKPDVSSQTKAKEVYERLQSSQDYFCEEAFIQTGPLGEVNPNCVNTIRIYTLFDGSDVHIMNTCVRFGGNTSCVDNIHSGGMTCEIDQETGVIIGAGYNLRNEKFVKHGLTGVVLPGIKVPNWSQVLEQCKKAALLIPNYGYIGWDVAVSDDRVCIIEGNEVANVDMPQVACRCGFKKAYWAVKALTLANRKKNRS